MLASPQAHEPVGTNQAVELGGKQQPGANRQRGERAADVEGADTEALVHPHGCKCLEAHVERGQSEHHRQHGEPAPPGLQGDSPLAAGELVDAVGRDDTEQGEGCDAASVQCPSVAAISHSAVIPRLMKPSGTRSAHRGSSGGRG